MVRWRYLSLAVALVLGLAVAVALLAFYDPAQAQATMRYVAVSGADGGDCLDPGHPCRTVQYAVDASANNDIVKVATGVYTDVHARPPLPGDPFPPPGGTVHQVVYISRTLTVQGGYLAPHFGEPPDPRANPTTLDARGQGRVFYVVGEINPTLEGLVTRGGRVGNTAVEPGYGGGLYIVSATVTVSGCAIQGNEAVPLYEDKFGDLAPVQGGQGGGLYAHGGDISILHSSVVGNDAWHGAGLYLHGGAVSLFDSDVQGNTALADAFPYTSGYGGGLYLIGTQASLVGNAVIDNRAWGDGGGLYVVGSRATLDGNTIAGNTGAGISFAYGWGAGGGLLVVSSQVTLTGNTVSGNDSDTSGGGLYLAQSEAVLVHNRVNDNYVVGGRYGLWGGGGGLYLDHTRATLSKNVVQSNHSELAPGGALCLSHSDLHVENTVIAGNTSGRRWMQGGGAIDLDGSVATLAHVTLARNTGSEGSGLHVAGGSAITLTNAIVASHTIGITVSAGSTASLEATLWGTGLWTNGTDWGGAGTLFTGTVNLWGDPGFVAPSVGDYHIGPTSAAVNRGIPAGIDDDVDGELRPDWCFYDIGADELLTGKLCWRVNLPTVLQSSAQDRFR